MTTTEAPPDPAAVEWEMAADMLRRALPLAPALVGIGALGWGMDGALSAAFGVAMVAANLAVSAGLMAWAARRSLGVLGGVALGGAAVRMALVALAIAGVRDQAWVAMVPLGLTIVVTQLGLLWWETRHLSLTLAYPGVKPRGGG